MGNLCPSARCIADEQKAAFERHVRMETLFQSTPVIADERMERGTHSPHCLNRFQSTPVIADERMLFSASRSVAPSIGFQSTPVIADERMRMRRAGGMRIARFNPRPSLLTSECRGLQPMARPCGVSIHARHC